MITALCHLKVKFTWNVLLCCAGSLSTTCVCVCSWRSVSSPNSVSYLSGSTFSLYSTLLLLISFCFLFASVRDLLKHPTEAEWRRWQRKVGAASPGHLAVPGPPACITSLVFCFSDKKATSGRMRPSGRWPPVRVQNVLALKIGNRTHLKSKKS